MVTSSTEHTSADYAAMIGVNLTDLFALTQRVVPPMLAIGAGHHRHPDAWARRPRRPGEDASSGQDR
jgi:hypothetical protein